MCAHSEANQSIEPDARRFERVLVIRPGAIGDLLVTLPVLGNLRMHCPGAYIELITSPSVIPLLQDRCEADKVRSFNAPEFTPLFVDDRPIPDPTRTWLATFDLIIAYIPTDSVMLRPLRAVGHGQVLALDPRPRPHSRIPISLYLQKALEPLGWEPQPCPPRIELHREDMEFAAHYWRDVTPRRNHHGPVIAIHPGSGSPKKNWPAGRFADLADRLSRNENAQIAVVCGPADEGPVTRMLAREQIAPATILHDLALPRLAAVLRHCQCFIGNDGGIAHLAAAVGLSGVVIFGPTDPRIWAPGPTFAIARPKSRCAPCADEQRRGCERTACLESITVEEVYTAAQSCLTPAGSLT